MGVPRSHVDRVVGRIGAPTCLEAGTRDWDTYMALLLKIIGDKKKEEGRDAERAAQAKAKAAQARAGGAPGGASPKPDVNMAG